ncbi:MAG: rod shape-determining protein RodA [Acidobacteriota bacterium]
MLRDRLRTQFDWPTFGVTLSLCLVGMLMIASTTLQDGGDSLRRQGIWLGLGLAGMLLVIAVDYHTWAALAWVLYGAAMAGLVYVLIFGREISGARSWIELGPANLQPAELAKVATVLAMAAFLGPRTERHLGARNLLVLCLLAGTPAVLILLQPDMGTLLPFIPLLGVLALLGGIRVRTMVAMALVVALILPVAWTFVLKDYQKERVLTFFDPGRDPRGAGYQVIQSKIALGSGGMTGKGFFSGTQGQLHFLPAQHTDFIFSVLGEEGGFVATAAVLGLYFLLLWRCFVAAESSRDLLGVYLCIGIAAMLATQILFNTGVVVGLLPTAGITLPLLSYGGSSLISTLIAIGLIINVRMRRFVN